MAIFIFPTWLLLLLWNKVADVSAGDNIAHKIPLSEDEHHVTNSSRISDDLPVSESNVQTIMVGSHIVPLGYSSSSVAAKVESTAVFILDEFIATAEFTLTQAQVCASALHRFLFQNGFLDEWKRQQWDKTDWLGKGIKGKNTKKETDKKLLNATEHKSQKNSDDNVADEGIDRLLKGAVEVFSKCGNVVEREIARNDAKRGQKKGGIKKEKKQAKELLSLKIKSLIAMFRKFSVFLQRDANSSPSERNEAYFGDGELDLDRPVLCTIGRILCVELLQNQKIMTSILKTQSSYDSTQAIAMLRDFEKCARESYYDFFAVRFGRLLNENGTKKEMHIGENQSVEPWEFAQQYSKFLSVIKRYICVKVAVDITSENLALLPNVKEAFISRSKDPLRQSFTIETDKIPELVFEVACRPLIAESAKSAEQKTSDAWKQANLGSRYSNWLHLRVVRLIASLNLHLIEPGSLDWPDIFVPPILDAKQEERVRRLLEHMYTFFFVRIIPDSINYAKIKEMERKALSLISHRNLRKKKALSKTALFNEQPHEEEKERCTPESIKSYLLEQIIFDAMGINEIQTPGMKSWNLPEIIDQVNLMSTDSQSRYNTNESFDELSIVARNIDYELSKEPSDCKEKQHHINQYSDEKRLSSFLLHEISPKTSQFVEANFILEQALGFGETQEQPYKRDVLRRLRRMFVKLSTHVLHITDPWEKHNKDHVANLRKNIERGLLFIIAQRLTKNLLLLVQTRTMKNALNSCKINAYGKIYICEWYYLELLKEFSQGIESEFRSLSTGLSVISDTESDAVSTSMVIISQFIDENVRIILSTDEDQTNRWVKCEYLVGEKILKLTGAELRQLFRHLNSIKTNELSLLSASSIYPFSWPPKSLLTKKKYQQQGVVIQLFETDSNGKHLQNLNAKLISLVALQGDKMICIGQSKHMKSVHLNSWNRKDYSGIIEPVNVGLLPLEAETSLRLFIFFNFGAGIAAKCARFVEKVGKVPKNNEQSYADINSSSRSSIENPFLILLRKYSEVLEHLRISNEFNAIRKAIGEELFAKYEEAFERKAIGITQVDSKICAEIAIDLSCDLASSFEAMSSKTS